jgi:hypothetical protein
MHKWMGTTAAAVVALTFATAASATVTFDPNSGTGFVGKGDVQTAFGWNNAQAQANLSSITFSYKSGGTFDVTCEFDTPGPVVTHHIITQTKTSSVNATVDYSFRVHHQIDGIYLTGFGQVITTGDKIPSVGDGCPGNSGLGAITAVTPIGSTATGLFVTYGGNSVQLTF